MVKGLQHGRFDNPDPVIIKPSSSVPTITSTQLGLLDEIDLFDCLRMIRDPEHPNYTLEQLYVIQESLIFVNNNNQQILIEFVPTVKHCSLVSHIALCIRHKMKQTFPAAILQKYKIDLRVQKGSHQTEDELNKQINDKERVAAALDNPMIIESVLQCTNEEER